MAFNLSDVWAQSEPTAENTFRYDYAWHTEKLLDWYEAYHTASAQTPPDVHEMAKATRNIARYTTARAALTQA